MGLDLTLVVNWYDIEDLSPTSYERLILERDYRLFEAMKEVNPVPFVANRNIWWYGSSEVFQTNADEYGVRLTSTTAKRVAMALDEHNLITKNNAVRSYMLALPENTEIILWWH